MKEKLIQALEFEFTNLGKTGFDTQDHELAIGFLKNGHIPKHIRVENYDILDAAINDLECLYSDYGIK